MEKEELEKTCNVIIGNICRNNFFDYKNRLQNQPKINGYLKPTFSHMEIGLVYFDYESIEYRHKLK